jgi:hypothetical protein
MLNGVIIRSIADTVRYLILKPALIDVEHLVKRSRNMESKSRLLTLSVVFRVIKLCQFLLSEPPHVTERILQFVAVTHSLFGPQDRTDFRQLDFGYSGEVVNHLLLLVTELLLIRKILPFAASANTEMAAKRHGADIGQFMELYGNCLSITVFLLENLEIHYISGHYKRYKNHKVIDPDKGFALGSHSGYGNILNYGLFASLFGHNAFFWDAKLVNSTAARGKS